MYSVAGKATLQIVFRGFLDGQEVITTMSYNRRAATPHADGGALLTNYLNKVIEAGEVFGKYIAAISSGVTDIGVFGQWTDPTRYAYKYANNAVTAGAIAGACMPSNVAACVTRRGDLAVRSNISNLHLPGLPVAAVTDSIISPAHMVLLLDFANQSLAPLIEDDGDIADPVAYHRAEPDVSAVLVDAYAHNISRVQRRRTVGVGS